MTQEEREHYAALKLECPTCGRRPGDLCITLPTTVRRAGKRFARDGHTMVGHSHAERVQAARNSSSRSAK